MNENLSRS
ncbi:hypothetical protein VCHENC02_5041A, partial [Vibrio harveyi]